ncbi:MAG: hypothetical protein FJZ58_00565 [Chlamydiae bacterium]|nr:hypothetical protein [Chlamydiota bacterium]
MGPALVFKLFFCYQKAMYSDHQNISFQKANELPRIVESRIIEMDGRTWRVLTASQDPSAPERVFHITKILSLQGRKLIQGIPLNKVLGRMRFYEKSEKSIACVQKRITLLQKLIKENASITLQQLHTAIDHDYRNPQT